MDRWFFKQGTLQELGKLAATGIDEQLLLTVMKRSVWALAAGLQFYSAYPMTPSLAFYII
jgi:hypothetical protein